MKFSSLAALFVAALVCVLISGCGDQFRPVATPLPLPSPTPQNARFAAFTSCFIDPAITDPLKRDCSATDSSTNPPTPAPSGASTDINVSGDTVVGITLTGRSPINALAESTTVATADRDSDTVTSYTRLNLGTTTTVSGPTTTGLPSGAHPTALVNANGTIYVTESGRNVVGVLGGSPFSITAEVPVGTNPVNLTVLPNGKKIYVVNQGDSSVTVVDTTDNSVVATIINPLASSPVWAVPSADSSHVYVVNQGSSNVTVVDATNDFVVATLGVGSSPNFATFDTQNQRVIVTNPGAGTSAGSISVINADPTSPLFESVSNIAVGINPRSATALANGTRIYVANTGSHSISVVNSLSLTVSKTISLISSVTPADMTPSPVSIASDAESQKVMTANRDSNDISIINTATDTEVTDLSGKVSRIPAPPVVPTCVSTPAAKCAQLNPVFIAISPG